MTHDRRKLYRSGLPKKESLPFPPHIADPGRFRPREQVRVGTEGGTRQALESHDLSQDKFKWTPKRIGAAAVALAVLSVPVFNGISEMVSRQQSSEIPTMPDVTTENGQHRMDKMVKDGKVIGVRVDPNHSTLWSVASVAYPNMDLAPVVDSLQHELGGSTNVVLGQTIYVPKTDAALEFIKRQNIDDR